ncbi:MAG: hypothetical protein ACI37T_05280 [Candidatus Gastranaerophilaceae bacterium]
MNIFKKNYFIFCALFLICGFLSVYVGLDNTVEFRLYHLWNAHSFVTGRHSVDFAYVGLQAYFNPLFDLQYYYLVKWLNNFPQLFLFLQGFWGALDLFFFYKVIDLLIIEKGQAKTTLILGSLFTACTSYLFIYEIGTSLTDLQLCFLPLCGLYILFKELFKKDIKYKNILLSGVFFGLTAGFKLTFGMYALTIILALLFFIKQINCSLKFFSFLLLGMIIGFFVTGGYWCFFLWQKFGNPIFPYYENFFKTGYSAPVFYNYIYNFPQNFLEWIAFPFFFYNNNQPRVLELVVRDYRWTIGYTIFVIYYCCTIFNIGGFRAKIKESFENFIDIDKMNVLMLFIVFSYIIWIIHFSVIRYLALIEMLLCFIIMLFLYFICTCCKLKKRYIFCVVLLCIFLYTTTLQMLIRRVTPNNVIIDVEDVKIPDNAIVLSYGMETSYLSVYQNPKVKYIYGITDANCAFQYSEKMLAKMKKLLDENKDNLYAIWTYEGLQPYTGSYEHTDRPTIMESDYYIDKNSCKLIYSNYNNDSIAALCKIYKKE